MVIVALAGLGKAATRAPGLPCHRKARKLRGTVSRCEISVSSGFAGRTRRAEAGHPEGERTDASTCCPYKPAPNRS